MGLRGPKAMSPEERAARGGRDRSKPSTFTEAHRRQLERQIATLERIGHRWVIAADRLKQPAHANQKMAMGLKCLEQANTIRARLDRLSPPVPTRTEAHENGTAPAGLEGYSRARSR